MATSEQAPAPAHSRVPGPARRYADIGAFDLEFGGHLPNVTVAFETYGTFTGGNAVLVEHALTGDAHVAGPAGADQPTAGWWDAIVGPGLALDTDHWFIVCANVLGGCRGTTGPSSTSPDGTAWGSHWPRVTVRDQVEAERRLADHLGIEWFACVIGGSMGGMRALEWVVTHPDRVRSALLLATTAVASADQIGTQTTQIAAITSDPNWHDGDYAALGVRPETGLSIARQIAHLTYRSENELAARFGHVSQQTEDAHSPQIVGRHAGAGRFAVQSYLQHHGRKLVDRFDAGTYVALTDAMNTHDVSRGRGDLASVLGEVSVPVTVAGITNDRLYPLYQQEQLADLIPTAGPVRVIDSVYGHDGFLIEEEQVGALVREVIERVADPHSRGT